MDKLSLDAAFDSIEEYWTPHLASEVNGQAVKLAKTEGAFVWHSHDGADELFLVHSGTLRIEFRERDDVTLQEGESLVVPRGTEHRPVAEPEAEILLFEPAATVNTGDADDDRQQAEPKRLD